MPTSRDQQQKQKQHEANVEVVRLWQLPDDFFALSTERQWSAMTAITSKAEPHPKGRRRTPCSISFGDDALAVSFFLITLGTPLGIAALIVLSVLLSSYRMLVATIIVSIILALHPMPTRDWRRTRLSLALIRYFSMEVLVDRSNPLLDGFATSAVDDAAATTSFVSSSAAFSSASTTNGIDLPLVCLACPHGVFNYGAMIWCAMSRWFVGWEQNSAAASVVKYVPGLRYMDQLIWAEDAGRSSIQRVSRKRCTVDNNGGDDDDDDDDDDAVTGETRRYGGMLGIVPDGILGAFRCRGGVDELAIGPRRGLMRLCIEEGATVLAAWFFGTTDMLTVVQDPFGIMEWASRKMQAGMMGFYGRWGMPVPRRIPVSLCVAPYKCQKMDNPTKEDVEMVHNAVYGGLNKIYNEQKIYAGYPDRTLHIS